MSDQPNKKVAVVTKCLPNYRHPVFKMLQDDGAWDLKIYTTLPLEHTTPPALVDLNVIHPKGLNLTHKTHHGEVDVEQVEPFNIPILLPFYLLASRPKIIISGMMGPASMMSYFVSKILRVPFLIWSEDTLEATHSVSRVQKWFRSILIPGATAFLAWGKPSREFLLAKGVDESKIHYCAQAVDNEHWIQSSMNSDSESKRKSLGVKGRVFMTVGWLLARKGFDNFLQAWAKLPRKMQEDNQIMIIGDGDQRPALEQMVTDLGIPNVLFTGAKTQQELPEYFAASDVFVFPSLVDVWGMVVNEAMACGIPVLGSKYAGASQELIDHDEVGELIDPLDSDAFAQVLKHWIERELPPPELLREHIGKINFGVSADAFRHVVREYTR